MALDKIPSTSISGSNVISVTANSSSTVNVNSVNFINTSSIKVTVEQGAFGVANVSFTSPVSLGMVIALGGE